MTGNILQIDGWNGSGKSLLQGYLDGHSHIAPNPIHDGIHMAMLAGDHSSIFEWQNIDRLRRILSQYSQYYYLERYARKKYFQFAFKSGTFVNIDFNFDFYNFDQSWVNEILDSKFGAWEGEKIATTIYKHYAHHLTGKSSWQYQSTMGYPHIDKQRNFFSVFSKGKSILVKRKIEQIIATRVGRVPLDDRPPGFFDHNFLSLMQSNEIGKIINYYRFWENMKTCFPERCMIIDFEDLVFNRENTMYAISDFLNIPFEPILLKCTVMGKEIIHQGVNYSDTIQDEPNSLLTAYELKRVRKTIKKKKNVPKLMYVTGMFAFKTLQKVIRILNKIGGIIERKVLNN